MRRWLVLAALLGACGGAKPPPRTPYSFPGCPSDDSATDGCPNGVTFECAESHVASQFASPCASDADCTWAPVSGTCFSDCGTAVTVAHQSEFETSIHQELDRFCAGSQCQAQLGCATPPRAACRSGTCVSAPLDFGPDAGCAPPAPTSFCSTTTCYASWPEVLAACDPGLQLSSCGGFDIAVQSGMDQSGTGYFDPTSGALVAVVLGGSGNVGCHGPPDFVAPTDCGPDAGAIIAACDAGM